MSDENILIGYVAEPLPRFQPDPGFFRAANDGVLAGLPSDDPWPPLCRSLFSVTGDNMMHGAFRGQRLIHFAGHFNHLLSHLGEWLDKFEHLLRRLYWVDAEVLLLHAWSGPPLVVRYSVLPETIESYTSDAPRPPRTWELRGFRLQTKEAAGDELADFLGSRTLRGPGDGP